MFSCSLSALAPKMRTSPLLGKVATDQSADLSTRRWIRLYCRPPIAKVPLRCILQLVALAVVAEDNADLLPLQHICMIDCPTMSAADTPPCALHRPRPQWPWSNDMLLIAVLRQRHPSSSSLSPRRSHTSRSAPPLLLLARPAVLDQPVLAPYHVASTRSCTCPHHDLGSGAQFSRASSVAVVGAVSLLTFLVVVLMPLCLVWSARGRLDVAACCALILFAGPATTTVGLAPPLKLEVSRDSEDICGVAPPTTPTATSARYPVP